MNKDNVMKAGLLLALAWLFLQNCAGPYQTGLAVAQVTNESDAVRELCIQHTNGWDVSRAACHMGWMWDKME